MRAIFFGMPEFAVNPLKNLINSERHKIVAVVTQPDRPVGRKAVITPPPVKVEAQKFGIPVYQFENLKTEGAETLKKIDADIMITCAYGQILTQEIIDICKFGIINVHASLLPLYRGAAPIQYAIINGEKKTGITFMQTDIGLDTGDIIKQYEVEIKNGETYGELSERLSVLASEKICGVLDEIERGTAKKTRQNSAVASTVKTIKKQDCLIDFTKNFEQVANLINGLNPQPVAFTFLNGKTVKIYRARPLDLETEGKAGETVLCDKKLVLSCGSGCVEVLEIQEEGGIKMPASAFIAGRKVRKGDVFGDR